MRHTSIRGDSLLRGSSAASLIVLFVVVVVVAPAARAQSVALVTASDHVDADTRSRLDAQVRRAFAVVRPALTLQPARDTATAMSTFIELNSERCEHDDGACWSKLGIIADVDTLIVLEASGRKKSLEVRCVVVDVAAGAVSQMFQEDVTLGDAASTEALIARALEQPAAPRLIDATAPHAPTPPPPPPTVPRGPGPLDETALTELQLAGVIVGGSGGALAVLGTLGALSCEAIYWTGTGTKELRGDVVAPLGAALWVGALIGVVTGGAGLGLWLAGTPVDEARLH